MRERWPWEEAENALTVLLQRDGIHPSGLIIDAGGNLYGTTYQGGKYNYGVCILNLDQQGNIFGITYTGGGSHNFGTIFKLDASGNETALRSCSKSAV